MKNCQLQPKQTDRWKNDGKNTLCLLHGVRIRLHFTDTTGCHFSLLSCHTHLLLSLPHTHSVFSFHIFTLIKMCFSFPIISLLWPNSVTWIHAFSIPLPFSHSLRDCESVCACMWLCRWLCVSVVNNLKMSSGFGKAMWATLFQGGHAK